MYNYHVVSIFTRKDLNMSRDKNKIQEQESSIDSDTNNYRGSNTYICNDISEDNKEISDKDDTEISEDGNRPLKKYNKKDIFIRGLRIIFAIGFFVFATLFINEVFIQPYKMNKSIEKAKDLYHYANTNVSVSETFDNIPDDVPDNQNNDTNGNYSDVLLTPTPTPDPNKDELGRLNKFSRLLEVNDDVKGWLRINNIAGENDTKIDYVVVQSDTNDPEYYLTRDWATHDYLKAGSLFLDSTSSIETNTRNLIIHGHNMTSSDDMFHYLLDYHELNFLKEHPIISFDTIYGEGLWKVFSVYITPGGNERDDFFPFVRSEFSNNRDYMEYLYQIRVRSLFNIDDVDINEDDQILTLSTCSYELSNYRTIVVARKVREGEEASVDTDSIYKNKNVLYPPSFYKHYGGKTPDIPTLDEALSEGLIPWYNSLEP